MDIERSIDLKVTCSLPSNQRMQDARDQCTCEIHDYEKECYIEDLPNVLSNPTGSYEVTKVIHTHCGLPVSLKRGVAQKLSGLAIPSKWKLDMR